jgi:hypothetical protein
MIRATINLASSLAVTVAMLLSVFAISGEVLAASKWRGRCFSQITGTDLGFVYASTADGLTEACARIANRPIVTESTQVECALNDVDPACTVSTPTSLTKCAGSLTNEEMNSAIASEGVTLEPAQLNVFAPECPRVLRLPRLTASFMMIIIQHLDGAITANRTRMRAQSHGRSL